MGVVSRWRVRLADALKRQRKAQGQVNYWTQRVRERGLSRAELNRRRAMLADRTRLLTDAKADVAAARRVIARHSVPTGISSRGVAFIASFEGGMSRDGLFRPYRDPVGVWTIGYGHTKGVGPNSRPLTKTQALKLLRKDLNEIYVPPVFRALRDAGMAPKQSIVDALSSASYNLGPGVLERGRSLGDAIRTRSKDKIADALLLYDKADGRRLEGLTRRRRAEAAMVRSA